MLGPDDSAAKQIDAALSEWRQGDVALDEHWFIHAGDPTAPLTPASGAVERGDDAVQALTSEVQGLVVLTQTCDIVRACTSRPYIEVAPLVLVAASDLPSIQRGRRPALAALPALIEQRLAVDLDRVMTVEKSIVAKWKRTPGYTSDAEARAFAQALARKRVRFAFPDDFTAFTKKLHARLGDKHEKNTDEGRGLRVLREIRVQASPSWDTSTVELFFWFIRDDADTDFEGTVWADLLKSWLKLVPSSGRFTAADGQIATLGEMTGADYVDSDRLDLDHLSSSSNTSAPESTDTGTQP
jgi:hypothetical protein